jgi:hypothetical protein
VPRIILLLAVIFAGYIIYLRIKAQSPAQRKKSYIQLGLASLIIIVVVATLTGRMHWLGAAITGLIVGASRLLPMLIRMFPALQWLHRKHAAAQPGSSNQQSSVETSILRMSLDHDTGAMNGEVLSGEFAGKFLDDLDETQLRTLLDWVQASDQESARLLETYLQRRFGDSASFTRTPPAEDSGNMTRSEALAVLGLGEDASEEEIVAAHRRLMQKLHPDRGGNDYLAAKINQAKDTLQA